MAFFLLIIMRQSKSNKKLSVGNSSVPLKAKKLPVYPRTAANCKTNTQGETKSNKSESIATVRFVYESSVKLLIKDNVNESLHPSRSLKILRRIPFLVLKIRKEITKKMTAFCKVPSYRTIQYNEWKLVEGKYSEMKHFIFSCTTGHCEGHENRPTICVTCHQKLVSRCSNCGIQRSGRFNISDSECQHGIHRTKKCVKISKPSCLPKWKLQRIGFNQQKFHRRNLCCIKGEKDRTGPFSFRNSSRMTWLPLFELHTAWCKERSSAFQAT